MSTDPFGEVIWIMIVGAGLDAVVFLLFNMFGICCRFHIGDCQKVLLL